MKKSLVALAVLGAFAAAASAQSSVTVYGIADIGFSRVDPKAGTVSEALTTTGIDAGNRNGNRLGFRGTEDLGGGLNAIFQLENGFSLDTGTLGQGGRLFGRQAYAGVSGAFGRIVAGRVAAFSSGTGAFDMFGDMDPFYTGYHTAGMQNTFSSAGSLRMDNAILWQSANMSGFRAGLGLSFRGDGSENPGGGGANNTVQFAAVSFGSGPFYGAITFDRFKQGEVAADPVAKHLQIGATFDMKVVKLHGAYAQEDNFRGEIRVPGGAQATGSDASAIMLGVSVPLGAGKLLASVQKRDVDALGLVGQGDRKVFGLGYEYNLSRRTMVHGSYGARTDGGTMKTTTSGGQSQMVLGMTHFF